MGSWDGHVLLPYSLSSSSKNSSVLGELRASPSFLTDDSIFNSSLPVNAGQALVDLGFQDAPMKRVLGDSVLDSLPDRINRGSDANGRVAPSVAARNGFPIGEEDSYLKLSGSMVDPSPMIDLKLGRLAAQRDGHCSRLSRGAPTLTLSDSSNPSKRCRAAGLSNQAVYCQVFKCNKDLTSLKEYYRRHKVCDVHSKTPKVIVKGIEQRFCQQCSRFHLLREFDDGKRSCRKQLAGHNQRRRKPRVGFHSSGSTAGFLLPCNGTIGKFNGANDWISRIKLEARTNHGPIPSNSVEYRDLHPRLPLSPPSTEKELCSFQEIDRDSSTTVCLINNITRCSGLFNKDLTLGTEEFDTIFNTESFTPRSSEISGPSCARSLLSSVSHNSSAHASGVAMAHSLSQHDIAHVSDNCVVNRGSRRFLSPGKGYQEGPPVGADGDSASFEISNEVLHVSGFSNSKGHLSDEEATTIDLLQLSSQLQRVEHERQYMQLEFDSLECVRMT